MIIKLLASEITESHIKSNFDNNGIPESIKLVMIQR